ncbi:MAG: hypothetical protein WC833_13545 [Bacteroidales bacterium]
MKKRSLIPLIVIFNLSTAYAQYNEIEFIGNVKSVTINEKTFDISYTTIQFREFDTLGRLIKIFHHDKYYDDKYLTLYRYNISGKLEGYNMYRGDSESSPIMFESQYVYENGRIAKEKFKGYVRDKGILKEVQEHENIFKYDQRGLLLEGTYIECGPGYFTYDSLGRLIESDGYEHSERLVYKGDHVYQMIIEYGDEEVFTYNDDGRLALYERYSDGLERRDGHEPIQRYSYRYLADSSGNWTHLYCKNLKTGEERLVIERIFEYR